MARSDKSTPFSVQGKLPRISQLNKKTIMLLGMILLIIFVLILFSAFSSSNDDSTQSNTPQDILKTQDSGAGQTTPAAITQLPSSYSDAQAINALLNRNQSPQKVTATVSPEVLAQINTLQAQQVQLESQLSMMKAQAASRPVNQNEQTQLTPLDQEAMTSAIFFSGGAPAPVPIPPVKTADAAKKDAAAASKGQGNTETPYEKQNMQNVKLGFLNSKPTTSIYNKNRLQYPGSKYILQAGSSIPAILKTKLDSSNPGFITAIVTQNVYDSLDGQYLLIPKGTVLIGEYSSQVAFGQSSLQAKFIRMIRPDGTSILLPNEIGGDQEGVSGLTDQVNNHWGQVIGAAVLAAVFNIPSIVATNQMNNSANYNSTTGYTPAGAGVTASASAMQSFGQSASQMGSQLTQRSLNLQPTITIRAGYQFSVMVTKDIILPPYRMPFHEKVVETLDQ